MNISEIFSINYLSLITPIWHLPKTFRNYITVNNNVPNTNISGM